MNRFGERPGEGNPRAADSQPNCTLCRTQAHIDAALVLGIPRLYLDFEDIRRYADAVKQIKERQRHSAGLAGDTAHSEIRRGGFLQAHPACGAAWRAHSQSRSHVVLPGRRHSDDR
jgi:hypothetical protein